MSNDGDKEVKKRCPFLKEWCIGDACAIRVELIRSAGGVQQKFTMCPFPATVIILGEINAKMQPPQQKIQLPHILRG